MISTSTLQRILLQAQMHEHVRMPGPKLAEILTELLEYRKRDPLKQGDATHQAATFFDNLIKGVKK